jgi:hypothetical protein
LTPVTVALSVTLSATPIEEFSLAQERLFEQTSPSVVYISNSKGFGSSFFINDTGLILTNAHVVGEENTVTVVLHDGRKFSGTVVERGADQLEVALVNPNSHQPGQLGRPHLHRQRRSHRHRYCSTQRSDRHQLWCTYRGRPTRTAQDD